MNLKYFMKEINSLIQKHLIIFYFLFMVIFARLILPVLIQKNDFLIFYDWSMFSTSMTPVYDLSWDGGQTFLFRDYRQSNNGINQQALYYLVSKNDLLGIQKHLQSIRTFCRCQNIEIFSINLSPYKYFIERSLFSDAKGKLL
jgi:hypothetical protein